MDFINKTLFLSLLQVCLSLHLDINLCSGAIVMNKF